MSLFKIFLKGNLDFGSEKSFEKAFQLFMKQSEVLYKSCIVLKAEEIFDAENNRLILKQQVLPSVSDKHWKNTKAILRCMAQFSQAGQIWLWCANPANNHIIETVHIEPNEEKAVVADYKKGSKLLKAGDIDHAKKHLKSAIEKYEKHTDAYERMGKLKIRVDSHESAINLFTKSIEWYDENPKAYFGRALAYAAIGENELAINDLDKAIKNSFPIQPIYWKARRRKGELHIAQKEFDKAAFEFKFFTKRPFIETDPNFRWKRYALIQYSKALLETGFYNEAKEAWLQAKSMYQHSSLEEPIMNYLDLAFMGQAKEVTKATKNSLVK